MTSLLSRYMIYTIEFYYEVFGGFKIVHPYKLLPTFMFNIHYRKILIPKSHNVKSKKIFKE